MLKSCFRFFSVALLGAVIAAAPAPTSAAPARAGKAASKSSGKRGKKPAAKSRNRYAVKGKKRVFLERIVPAMKGGMPNIQAQAALVLDENGRELFNRNGDRERPIASISKLAAVLVVMDRGLDLDGLSTITKVDAEVARGGAKSRLLEGMTLSNRDLLHAALMGSDNRAVPALGRAVKLSPSQLAAAMNAKAKQLGLKHTRFHEPTGLSQQNVSTPRETIVMLKAVMKHPVLGAITSRGEYDAHPVSRPEVKYVNTWRPAQRSTIQVLGGKTGYNDDARYCLVIATRVDGHTYYMSFLANEGKLTRFGDVARVADWLVSRKPKGTPTPATTGSGATVARTEAHEAHGTHATATATAKTDTIPANVATP